MLIRHQETSRLRVFYGIFPNERKHGAKGPWTKRVPQPHNRTNLFTRMKSVLVMLREMIWYAVGNIGKAT